MEDLRNDTPREELKETYPQDQREELDRVGSVTASIQPVSITDFLQELLASARRLYLLPVIFSVIFCALLCIRARMVFNPIYEASATFTVNVANVSTKTSSTYSINLAKQLSETFPYIFNSDVLNNLIRQDLGMDEIPATITAESVGENNLFTIHVYSRTPQTSYQVLLSAIDNYPRVADFVVGNTSLTLLSESGIPSKPINGISYKTELVKGIGLGILASLIVMVIATLTKSTVRDTDDLKSMLNLRCFGTLPFVNRRKRDEKGMLEVTREDASKTFTDSVRLIRSRTQKACEEQGFKVVLVASSMPGEGKTTVAVNLAMSFALSGMRTALLDCDLRKPSDLAALIGAKDAGLVEYLNGEAELDDIINVTEEGLTVICGKAPSDEAAELLGTARMQELVDSLRGSYDMIVLDSPPASVIADAIVLSNLADGIVYVIRREFARKSRILDGLNHLSNGRAAFLGYVLNSSDTTGGYGYGYGSYSRYGKYSRYGRYGRYGSYGRYGAYSRYSGKGKSK